MCQDLNNETIETLVLKKYRVLRKSQAGLKSSLPVYRCGPEWGKSSDADLSF